jgi:hypothetical protein
MSVRMFALILGIIYLLVGIAGFIPGLVTYPVTTDPNVVGRHGYLLGLFPVNWLHNLVHLGVGAWGIFAYASLPAARVFSKSIAVIFGILFIFGLIPGLSSLFGLVPLWGHDIWLHLLTAAAGTYFGWFAPAIEPSAHRATDYPGTRY